MPNIVTYNYTNTLGRNMIKPGYTTVGIGITGPYQPNYSQTFLNSTWRNGFDTSSGTVWVLYSNDFSQGVQGTQANGLPVGWTTGGNNTSLLELINVIPERSQQTPFGDLASAVAWVIADGNYLIQNREYPAIGFENNLMLAGYDPATTISYPRVGNSVWDISGRESSAATKTGSLDVEQDSTPFHFDFDGTGDAISIPTGLARRIVLANNVAFSISLIFNLASFPADGFGYTILDIGGSTAIDPQSFIRLYFKTTGADTDLRISGNLNETTGGGAQNFDVLTSFGSSGQLAINTYFHLGVVVDESGGKFRANIYVNGISSGTVDLVTGASPSVFVSTGTQNNSYIGALKANQEYFPGKTGPIHIFEGNIGESGMTLLKDVLNSAYSYGI